MTVLEHLGPDYEKLFFVRDNSFPLKEKIVALRVLVTVMLFLKNLIHE